MENSFVSSQLGAMKSVFDGKLTDLSATSIPDPFEVFLETRQDPKLD